MDDREKYRPIIQGKTFPLLVEEVIKILRTLEPEKYVSQLPFNMRGGDVYVFKPSIPDHSENWKSDGQRWKNAGSVHLPRNKKSLIHKRYFTMIHEDGKGTSTDAKKDVYCWDMGAGAGESDIVLIHYVGNFGETDEVQKIENETATSSSAKIESVADDAVIIKPTADDINPLASAVTVPVASAVTSRVIGDNINPVADNTMPVLDGTVPVKVEPATTSRNEKQSVDVQQADTSSSSAVAMETTEQPDTTTLDLADNSISEANTSVVSSSVGTSSSTTALDAAMKTVKAAMEAKSGSKPMMDVFNKLMETVVSSDQNPDLEYCLVVADKRSGESSLIGTDEAKKLASRTPEIMNKKRSQRKRAVPADYEDDDADKSNDEPPSKRQKPVPKANIEDNEILMYNGEVLKLPKPKKETFFSYGIISDEEKKIHADFFSSRKSTKTPDRYLKIRNYIMDAWARQKPAFLNKLQARKGLAGCGDVTPISRIHAYLECKGVINYNAVKKEITTEAKDTPKPGKEEQEEEDEYSNEDDNEDKTEDSDEDFIPEVETRSTRGRKRNADAKSNTNNIKINSKTNKEKSDNNNKNSSFKTVSQPQLKSKKSKTDGTVTDEVKITPKSNTAKQTIFKKTINDSTSSKIKNVKKSLSCDIETPVRQTRSEVESSVRSSGRRTRNISTPNWADILSGRKSFREEGDVSKSPKGTIKYSKEESSSPKKGKTAKGTPVSVGKAEKDAGHKKSEKDVGNKVSTKRIGRSLKPLLDDTEKEDKDVDSMAKSSETVSKVETNPNTKRKPAKSVPNKVEKKSEEEVLRKETELKNSECPQNKDKDEEANKKPEDENQDMQERGENALKDESERTEVKENVKLEAGAKKGQPTLAIKTEPIATSNRSAKKSKVSKKAADMQEMEWTGSGKLYKIRNKGNRHTPYQLKIINTASSSPETLIQDVSNIDKPESIGRSARSKTSYKHVCKFCDRKFSLEYLLEEHLKSHGVKCKVEEDDIETNDNKTTEDAEIDEDFIENEIDLPVDDDRDEDYSIEAKDLDDDEEEEDDKNNVEVAEDKKLKREIKPKIKKVKTDMKNEKPVCKECGITFLSQANLKRHSLLHTNYMYECPYCAKIMKRKDYVLSHIRKCHKEVDLELNPVDFTKYTHKVGEHENTPGDNEAVSENEDSKENDVNEVKKEDDKYEIKPGIAGKLRTGLGKSVCTDCTKIFDAREDLEQHMILVHEKELKDSAYTCQACKKQFKNLVSYQVHKLTHRKREHDCPHCGEKFKSNSQLQVHKRHDHNIQYGTLMYFGYLMVRGRITCEICSLDFDSMKDYHDHRPDHLTLEYLCRECGNGFNAEEELQKHTESQCQDQNLHLPCGVCDLKFAMYDTRRKHILTNHPKSTDYLCHHCGACFEDMEYLRMHFPIHKSEKIFECEYCEKTFFEKRNLIDHRHLHRSTKNFQCNICDKFYISSKSLQRHVKLHMAKDKKPCKFCDSKFQFKEDLDRHMEQSHGDIEEDQRENYEHKCNICSRTFLLKSRLVKHMQVHNNVAQEGSIYQCKVCNEQFDTVIMPLWKHMKLEHTEELKKPKNKKELICEICGFTTLHKQRLQRHMETHNTEKMFACKICHKKFQTTSSMLTHMIIHRGKIKQGISPHTVCRWQGCNRKFLKRSNMKRHLLSHIFKVKVGKDLCDCKNCPAIKYGDGMIQGTQFTYFEDNSNGDTLEGDDNVEVTPRKPGSVSVVLTAGGAIQGYESMDVLQEAIAQIEDIEKNTGTEEFPEMTTDPGVIISAKEDVLDNADDSGTAGAVIRIDEGETSVVQVVQTKKTGEEQIESRTADANKTAETVDAGTQSVKMVEGKISEEVKEVDIEGYECSVCELVFKTKCQVLYHSEEDHADNQFPICDFCGKHYIDQKALREHATIHSGTKDFKCETCGKTFRTKQCIRQHSFIHAEVKPFICSYCGHGFTQRGFFEEHVRRHTGIKPFACSVCSKAFVSKGLLKSHMYSHTGNKPHKCSSCDKSFTDNYQLVAHERTHNDDRPFQCTECDKAFFVKPKLIRHMHTVHSIQKEALSNYVATKINDGIGYRDRTKLKNYNPESSPRKTQVVYIDAQGNIISQMMKTEEEIRAEKEQMILQKIQTQMQRKAERHTPYMIKTPGDDTIVETEHTQEEAFEVVTSRDASGNVQVNTTLVSPESPITVKTETDMDEEDMETFEVVTTRDATGQIQVNTIAPNGEHVIIENGEAKTIVSIPEREANVIYEMNPIENDGSIELDGQNYTFVTQADGQSQEGHLELITQALSGVQAQSDADQGQIQVITEEITGEQVQMDSEGNIEIYTQDNMETETHEASENFSINIGEDGTMNAADFEKIEALRNLYSDQQIVIVLESQQQEEEQQ